ncbi:MAG: Rieske 2Fe-2S domain-containing protein [Alphaproteobacteria bacterium]|nr:Rieske 2Fe-2S domain-containing protein [Alphaproteobacteria bacterium]
MPHTVRAETSGTDLTPTLPARLYHNPAAYEHEMEKIFRSEWLLFCHESQVSTPGQYVAMTLAGRPVVVLRAKDGSLNGFHNVCRHRAAQIIEDGCGKAASLRCPYHGWVYDGHGKLAKAPGFGGDEKALCEKTSLFPVHVAVHGGLVFVSMADTPPLFKTSLGDLPKALETTDIPTFVFHKTASHHIACNWKTYVENYLEGYHIPAVHPALNREVDMETYRAVNGNRIIRHETQMKDPDGNNSGLWLWFWPHAMLNIYKGGMNLELVLPTGPETCRLHYTYFFTKDTMDHASTIDMSAAVTAEDITICENVQRNLKAGVYDTGVLSPRHEQGLGYFQSLIKNTHA